ncbi:PIG-L family deacetylase [Streptomyces sp. AcE210]|uniref:PIG-L family deacetylase n=1 Tax=Streptomyces sp. AcE210 TaxID=2292703 RepID=UPI000E30A856|nr:PIG-L family deacetylase [Streptomyces sp. AcE210]RFC70921.1 hypothetical protein DXZ75_27275 [Streptomyces sp. AcE210]
MLETGSAARDLVSFVLPESGGLVETADPGRPYVLIDADGAVVEPVNAFFGELQACGRPASTIRSYGMDLLRWWRFLAGWGLAWDRVTRVDAACTRLGVNEWNWLAEGRWTDTAGQPTPGSLTTASVSDLAEVIADQIQTIIPDVVLTVGPDGLTGHPDHILIHRAAASAAASCDVPVFGSYLLPADIAQGRDLLGPILPGERVGSGRMTGRDEPSPATLAAPARAGEARRAALDEYANGLGTLALKKLVRVFPGRGDSLLLRAVLDAIGWQTERYTCLVT